MMHRAAASLYCKAEYACLCCKSQGVSSDVTHVCQTIFYQLREGESYALSPRHSLCFLKVVNSFVLLRTHHVAPAKFTVPF